MRPRGGWALAIQVAAAVCTTLGLSTWQVIRGFEKAELRDVYVDRLAQDPIDVAELVDGENHYRKVSLTGRFDASRTFIVAYQRHLGSPGFWIIEPFDTDQGRFLVNRGWLAVVGTWFHTPEIETPEELLEIQGVVWPSKSELSTEGYEGDNWPKRVNRLNIEKMAEATGAHGEEIRLLAGSPGVLTPIHLSFEGGSSTHWSYAFQWLIIGALIVGGYWFFALRSTDVDS